MQWINSNFPPGTTNIFLSPLPTESSKVKIKSEDIINNDDAGSETETDTVQETVEKETPPESPKQEVSILIIDIDTWWKFITDIATDKNLN